MFPPQNSSRPAALLLDQLRKHQFEVRAIFRVEEVKHSGVQYLFDPISKDVSDRRVGVSVTAIDIDRPDPLISRLYDRTKLLFAVLDCGFSCLARSDVTRHTLHAN